jgi:transcriptional regulator with XRE-family HTH domain
MSEDKAKAREIGARLQQARLEKALRQIDVATGLGVSERSIQAYEHGETVPHRFRDELEGILGRPAEWLFDGERARRVPRDQEERLRSIEARLDKLEGR